MFLSALSANPQVFDYAAALAKIRQLQSEWWTVNSGAPELYPGDYNAWTDFSIGYQFQQNGPGGGIDVVPRTIKLGDPFPRLMADGSTQILTAHQSNNFIDKLGNVVSIVVPIMIAIGTSYVAMGASGLISASSTVGAGAGVGAPSLSSADVAALYGDAGYTGVIDTGLAPTVAPVAITEPAMTLFNPTFVQPAPLDLTSLGLDAGTLSADTAAAMAAGGTSIASGAAGAAGRGCGEPGLDRQPGEGHGPAEGGGVRQEGGRSHLQGREAL